MEERRRTPRIKEENEVAITVVSGGTNIPEEQIKDNYTKDISVSGAKIQTNILLPVNTLIELDFTSKGMQQQMKILGKIKWRKAINENESYEFGVEFYPSKEIEKLEDYISWQLKYDKSDFIKNTPSSIDSDNKKIVETNKLSPIDSGYINIEETKKVPPMASNKINIIETNKLSPMDSGYINFDEAKKLSQVDPYNINIDAPPIIYPKSSSKRNVTEAHQVSPGKNHHWIITAIIFLAAIILIVIALNVLGYLDLDFIYPHPDKKVALKSAHVSTTTKSAILPKPPVAVPAPKEASNPLPAPAPQATQIIKVIGNRDSKIYHLPGMKYYNTVKAYHRVEFDSETDALKAGYTKAPR
jgi:hypothetical protein